MEVVERVRRTDEGADLEQEGKPTTSDIREYEN